MRFESFISGLYLTESADFAIPVDALLEGTNIDYKWSGGIIGRRGVLKYNATALPGPLKGLWRHYPRGTTGPGTGKLFAVAQDGASHRFYTGNDGTGAFTEIAGTALTSSIKIPAFVNWPSKNKSFWAYGDDVNGMRSFDNTTVATVATTGLTAAKLGPYLALHKSRFWATYFGETNYSVYASNVNSETVWNGANHLNVGDAQGGTVTGLVSWIDYLLIFKATSSWRFLGDIGGGGQLTQYSDRGCIAPHTIQKTPYGVIFLDRAGLFITDGQSFTGEELSKPIKALFASRTGETVYPNAIGRWYEKRQQYWLKLDPTVAEGYILHRVEIYAENQLTGERSRVVWIWSKHSNLPMSTGAEWSSENDTGALTVGDENGFVRYVDTGATDDGTAYASTMQTASRVLDGNELRTGRVRRATILHRASAALTGSLRYDQNTADDVTFTNGDATLTPKETLSKIWTFNKMGRYVSVRLSRTGDGANLEVHRIDLDTAMRSPRVHRERNSA